MKYKYVYRYVPSPPPFMPPGSSPLPKPVMFPQTHKLHQIFKPTKYETAKKEKHKEETRKKEDIKLKKTKKKENSSLACWLAQCFISHFPSSPIHICEQTSYDHIPYHLVIYTYTASPPPSHPVHLNSVQTLRGWPPPQVFFFFY